MRIRHEDLKDLFQGYAASRKPRSRKRCPSPLAIARSFEPSASVRMKKTIVDHISQCSCCHEEFMILFEFHNLDTDSSIFEYPTVRDGPKRGNASDSRLAHPPFWQYACVLLGLTLAISSLFLLVHQKRISGIQRTGEGGIVLLRPKVNQSISGPIVFRWQRSVESEYFVLELFDESLLPIWKSGQIRDLQMLIPQDVYLALHPGKSYFWMVTAFSRDSRAEESAMRRFLLQ